MLTAVFEVVRVYSVSHARFVPELLIRMKFLLIAGSLDLAAPYVVCYISLVACFTTADRYFSK